MKRSFLLIALIVIAIGPVRSQDFGLWSYLDVLTTHHPQSWPSVINPLPIQKGYRLDSVYIIRTSQGDTLLTVDRCNWQGDAVEICRSAYYWENQIVCNASYYFDSQNNEMIYIGGDYSNYLRNTFDQLSRDSIIEAIDQAQNAGEGLYSIRQLFYNQNDELSAEIIRSSHYLDFTSGYLVPDNLNRDSITYAYHLYPDGKVASIIENHIYADRNNDTKVYVDSTLFFYHEDGKLAKRLFYDGKDQLITRTQFDYYSDSLDHITQTVFSGETVESPTEYFLNKGYNEKGEFVSQYDERYYGDVTFVRDYTISYDSLGRLKEWVYYTGYDRKEERKIIFFWPAAAYAENDLNQEMHFTIFPNPVENTLTIELSQVLFNDVTILIFDQSGRIVRHVPEPVGLRKYQLDLSHLDRGFYFIRVQEGNNSWVRRIVKVM